MTKETLSSIAEENNITVIYSHLDSIGSFSIRIDDFYIVISNELNEKDNILHLIYEISHCCSDSLYNLYSPLEERIECDRKAERWAKQYLFSEEELHLYKENLKYYIEKRDSGIPYDEHNSPNSDHLIH